MRALDQGESFIVSRHGQPVGELRPLRRHRHVPAAAAIAAFRGAATVDADRLQRVEAVFDPVPFGVEAARAYGRVHSAVTAHGGQPRRRAVDLMIAPTALAEKAVLVTRNPDDFAGLEGLIEIRSV